MPQTCPNKWDHLSAMATEKKFNKFEKVSPEPYIKLAQKNPDTASREIRKRYSELSNYADPNAIGGILKDERSKGWHELAQLLAESDPVLAKSIYIPLLRTRNYTYDTKTSNDCLPDMGVAAKQLYELEISAPEIEDKARLAVFSTLVECSDPNQVFWTECFKRTLELACIHTTPEKEGRILTIASLVFYSENIPELHKNALHELSQRIGNSQFLEDEPKPAWKKGYFFKNMNDFCIKEKYSGRNISFPANPNSALHRLLTERFWKWVDEYIDNKSHDALTLLQHAIHSYDDALSKKASEVYKANFYDIAVQSPKEASSCLHEIASYSCCYFTNGRSKEEKHQNFNLYEVFDETIPILKELNSELGILPFNAFLGSHRNVPKRIQQKYGHELSATRSMQISRKQNKPVSYQNIKERNPKPTEKFFHFFMVYGLWFVILAIVLLLSLF